MIRSGGATPPGSFIELILGDVLAAADRRLHGRLDTHGVKGVPTLARPPDRCRLLPWKIRIKVERPQRSEDVRP
jgi:hypothetical protein